MHILVIPSWYPTESYPSYGLFCYQQAHALKKMGHKVGVIFPELEKISSIFKPRRFGKITIESPDYVPTYKSRPICWLPKIPNGYAYLWKKAGATLFKKYIREQGVPDVIHVHTALWAGYLASEIKTKYGIPYLITEHNTAFARKNFKPWHIGMMKKIYQNASARVMVSPQLGELVESVVGDCVKPLQVIPNFIVEDFCKGHLGKSKEGTKFTFINIAELAEKKGHFNLLSAFANKFKNNESIQLKIGGLGRLKKKLIQFSIDLGIDQQVIFLGHLNRDQVCQELLAADVFVLSSLYETFGIVVIEALACGKPVIATICGGPEGIVTTKNGLLVEPGSISELGEAMVTIKKNIENYSKNSIREDCLSLYGEKKVMGQVEEILKNIKRDH